MATQTTKFQTDGMHCSSCSMLIEMNVGDLDGIKNVKADRASGITEVTYDPAVVDAPTIAAEIQAAGYTAKALA